MTHLKFSPTSRSLVLKVSGTMKKDTTASIGKFHKCWIVALLFMCLYFREVFNKIAAEEIDLFKAEESDDFEIPGFGTSTSSYDDVIKLT
jgi:hypothetical protein